MKLEEAMKLAREYDAWERGDATAPCFKGKGKEFVREVDRRKELNWQVRNHAYINFEAVVEALERLDSMCREYPGFMVTSDGRVHDLVEQALAKAKEVKT